MYIKTNNIQGFFRNRFIFTEYYRFFTKQVVKLPVGPPYI
jgi:hypothetical protein